MSASVWRKCRLSQVGNIISGGTPSTSVSEYWNGTISFVTPNDLSVTDSAIITKTNRNITTLGLVKSSANLLPEGTLIISTRAPIGYLAIAEKECTTNQGCKSVSFFSNQDSLFHYYNTQKYIQRMKALGSGTTFAEISKGDLEKIEITFPADLNEQQRIASILSTCDTVIHNTQKTIDKYKAIKQGMMQDLFTRGLTKDGKLRPSFKDAPELYKESELGMIPQEWEVDCIENLTAYVDYRGKTPIKIESGIQLVTAKNIKDGFIDYNISKEFIAKEDYNSVMSRGLPKLGDVLFTTEAPVGNVAQINDENVALAQRVIKFRGKETSMDNTFLLYSFLSEYFRRILLSESTGSTAQGIKGSRLHKLLLKYPSIPEQKKINEKLSSIDSTIQKEEAILEKYKNIKTGLMAHLLTPPADATIIDETGETL